MKRFYFWLGVVLFAAIVLVFMIPAFPQNPQTQTAPLFATNARYTNGVAPGYMLCGSAAANCPSTTGLHLLLGPGTVNCGSGTIATYAGGTLTLTGSTTNYVYLNTASSCAPAVKTSAFVAADIPIAVIVTGSGSITSISDVRTPFTAPAITTPGGSDGQLQYNNAGAFGGSAFTYDPTGAADACDGNPCIQNTNSIQNISISSEQSLISLNNGSDNNGFTRQNWDSFLAYDNIAEDYSTLTPDGVESKGAGAASTKITPLFILFTGLTSGNARIGVPAIAGTPSDILLPTTTGTSGQVLSTNGGSPQQTSWIDQTSGGGSVNVNGSAVSNPNFNDSNPAAPPGATNQIHQVDGSDVSSYDYSVQYQSPITNFVFMGDSSGGDDTHIISTAITVSGIVYTGSGSTTDIVFTGTNTLSVGDWIDAQGITSPSFMNVGNCLTTSNMATTGVCIFQVTAATGTTFHVTYPSNEGSGTGTGGTVYTANNYLPFQVGLQPFFNNHGTVALQSMVIYYASQSSHFTSAFGLLAPTNTGNPAWLIHYGDEDVYFTSLTGSCTASAIEGYYQNVWAQAHTLGYKWAESTTRAGSQTTSVSACGGNATTLWETVESWKRQQLCNASAPIGTSQCIDALIDLAGVTGGETVNPFQNGGHYTYAGIGVASVKFNDAMNQQGSSTNIPSLLPNGAGWDVLGTAASGKAFRVCEPIGTCPFGVDTNAGRVNNNFINLATLGSDQGTNGDVWFNGSNIKTRISGNVVQITNQSPLTTKGDLSGFSTVNARLPVGSDGQALLADSSQTLGIKWGSAGNFPIAVTIDTSTPVTVTTTNAATLHFNENATAATAIVYNLPTAAAGVQKCFSNANNGSAANTGTLTIQTSASGQLIIFTDGTLSASGGFVISGGAAGDAACVAGIDTTHWMLYVQRGTWAKH